MTPILYSFRRCPYAIRARMALKYSGIKVKIHEVSLKNKPASLLKISSKGQVPVLVMKDTVIDESRDIMAFALSVNDPESWLDQNEERMQKIEELITINDTLFKANLDRYKYFDKGQAESLENCRLEGEKFLRILENILSENDYLFADTISYGDIAIFPFIRQFSQVDKAWFDQSSYPHLRQWLEYFLASKLFNDVMIKDLQAL